jgi:hypothetical protein
MIVEGLPAQAILTRSRGVKQCTAIMGCAGINNRSKPGERLHENGRPGQHASRNYKQLKR